MALGESQNRQRKRDDLVSVIVPIYNIEKYIAPCVETIINQSYKNLEIFLVDDGSKDNSPKICDEYAKKDKRIKVIHKKNGGLSDARNVAIDKAKGEYIFLLDGDDTVHEGIIEALYRSIKKHKADIATSSFLQFEDGTNPRIIDMSQEDIKCLDAEGALENMLYQKDCTNTAWGKLYKKELFDDIRYPKGELYEDLATTYKLFAKAKRIVIDSRKMYNYRQRYGSIVNNSFNLKHLKSLDFAKEQTEFIQENYPNIIKAAQNREFMDYFYIFLELPPKQFPAIEKRLKEGMKRYRKTVLLDKESLKKPRLVALASCFGFWTLRPLTKMIGGARKINRG